MAACDTLRVTVQGVGGHGSAPHHAKDPIPAACEMVLAMETFVTRNIDIWDPVVVTTGSFHSGTADNIIPASARFETTIRSFSAESRERISSGLVAGVQRHRRGARADRRRRLRIRLPGHGQR